MTALSSPNASNHVFDVLIKTETEGKVSATVLGLPEYRVIESDRTSALAALQQLLAKNLAQTEIVSIDVAVPHPENPWVKMAGRFKDDPHFDEMLADIEAYRCERDTEMEFSLRKSDGQI